VANTGNSIACFSPSPSLDPWVIDSGATIHISGNRSLFSSFTKVANSPSIFVAYGSQK